jgi:thiamine pyrophosphate-dependent acetolactate synthase large subunit-like protein
VPGVEDLRGALQGALADAGPRLIEVQVAPGMALA